MTGLLALLPTASDLPDDLTLDQEDDDLTTPEVAAEADDAASYAAQLTAWQYRGGASRQFVLPDPGLGDFVSRLLQHMKQIGAKKVTPALRPEDHNMPLLPWIDSENFNPGTVPPVKPISRQPRHTPMICLIWSDRDRCAITYSWPTTKATYRTPPKAFHSETYAGAMLQVGLSS